ncbi:MAG: hypothetical protein ABJF88_07785 [Rhodothermales bacterium]
MPPQLMDWLALLLILTVAAVAFTLSRRVPARWRLAVGIPLMLWVLYYPVADGAYGYAAAMLLIFSYGIVRQFRSIHPQQGSA